MVPITVHLDHGSAKQEVVKSLELGFHSVMVDGSHLPFSENIAYTKYITSLAHAKNMTVEAELGRLSGTEDSLTVEEYEAKLTDLTQAEEFLSQTGVDALAVCIGNVHGKYPPSGPKLRLDLLKTGPNAYYKLSKLDESQGILTMEKILKIIWQVLEETDDTTMMMRRLNDNIVSFYMPLDPRKANSVSCSQVRLHCLYMWDLAFQKCNSLLFLDRSTLSPVGRLVPMFPTVTVVSLMDPTRSSAGWCYIQGLSLINPPIGSGL
eukprot:Gb_23167 [translate_table: standard]